MSRWMLVACLLLSAAPGLAQQECATCELDEAARRATAEGRLADAGSLLAQSLELEARPSTAYNLALVRQNQGRLLEAQELYRRLLSGDYGPLPEERRQAVAERLESVGAELATIVIELVDGDEEALIRIDGRDAGAAVPRRRLRIPSNPGLHAIRITRGNEAQDHSVEVGLGEERVLTVRFEAPPAAAPEAAPRAAPSAGDRGEDRSADTPPSRRGPRLLGVLLGVLAVGGAVALAVGLSRRGGGGLPPMPDEFLGSVDALFGR